MKLRKENSSKSHWLEAWHVSPGTNRDYDFIDGLRGIAILMVLIGHYLYINPKATGMVQFVGTFLGQGGYGVTLFFALSGFLISSPFWKRKADKCAQVTPPGYGWRRFWKIYPPLALSVILFVPFYLLTRHDQQYVSIAVRWLTGIAFFMPVDGKLNPVMWSLVVEVQFYVLLPLFFICLKRTSSKTSLWVIVISFIAVPMLFRFMTGLRLEIRPEINTHFPSAMDAFGLGILVAGMQSIGLLGKKWANLGIVGAILLPLSLVMAAMLNAHPEHKGFAVKEVADWLVKIAAGCLLCLVANPSNSLARFLCAPWLRWCGIISYEWYLFHQPVALWARREFGPAEGNLFKYLAIVGGPFLFTTIVVVLVYKYFSLPILKFGRTRNQADPLLKGG